MPNYRSLVPGGFYSYPTDPNQRRVSIKYNNPGALNDSSWQREIPGYVGKNETTPGNKTVIWEAPELGIISWTVLMHKYRDQFNSRTIRQILNTYGGSKQREHYAKYAQWISDRTGFPIDKVIDLDDDKILLPFAKAMFRYEAGEEIPWQDQQILLGFKLGREYVTTGLLRSIGGGTIVAPPPPAKPPVGTTGGRTWWQMILDALLPKKPAIIVPPPQPYQKTDDPAQMQQKLIDAGLLDPVADGKIGPLTRWALTQPLPPPLRLGSDLASTIVRRSMDHGIWWCRHPGAVNIFYGEGMDKDGNPNGNRPNEWNDQSMLIRFVNGAPEIIFSATGTTEPGKFFTKNRMNPGGAFRIAFGWKKAWTRGLYHNTPALRQADMLVGFRDNNEDFRRDGDKMVNGDNFGVHHHAGYDFPVDDIGRSSAGCLVRRLVSDHLLFMQHNDSDVRYRAVGAGHKFSAIVLPVEAFVSKDTSWTKFLAS